MQDPVPPFDRRRGLSESLTTPLDAFAEEPVFDRPAPVDESLDALDDFPSENLDEVRPSAAAAPAHPVFTPRAAPANLASTSLRQVHAAGIQLEWDEAVAVAQSLCDDILASHPLYRDVSDFGAAGASPAITLETVSIDAMGGVTIRGAGPRTMTEAIHGVGQTLSDILPPGDPLFFRARVVAKALSSPPEYASLEELSKSLAAYEPRNRRELVQKLHERATGRSEPATIVTMSIPLPSGEAAAAGRPTRAGQPRVSTRAARKLRAALNNVGAIAAVIVAGATVGGVAGWAIWRTPGPQARPRVVATPSAAFSEEGSAAPGVARDSRESPPASPTPSPTAGSQPVQRIDQSHTRGNERPSRLDSSSVARQPEPRRAASNAPVDSNRHVHVPPAPSATAPAPGSVTATVSTASANVVPDGRLGVTNSAGTSGTTAAPALATNSGAMRPTYDQDSADVSPPSVLYPQVLGVLMTQSPGVRTDALTIAVVVSEDGKVNSVKAVNSPRTIGESLLLTGALSTIKSGRFRPAMKEGVPVQYRLIVPLRAP